MVTTGRYAASLMKLHGRLITITIRHGIIKGDWCFVKFDLLLEDRWFEKVRVGFAIVYRHTGILFLTFDMPLHRMLNGPNGYSLV